MSFLDHAANPMLQLSVYKVLTAGVFRMNSTLLNEDTDDFSAVHMNADRLPAIEHCQSSIFRELRLREMISERQSVARPEEKAGRKIFGFKLRLSAMVQQPLLQLN